jgi:ribosome-associated protein
MGDLRVTAAVVVPEEELTYRFSRSGGPGGQNVNTRDTRVEVIFDVGQSPSLGPAERARALDNLAGRLDAEGKLHVIASDARTQGQNRELATARLKAILAEALRPPPEPRRPTKPSRAAVDRRIARKRARGRLKRQRSTTPDD